MFPDDRVPQQEGDHPKRKFRFDFAHLPTKFPDDRVPQQEGDIGILKS